MSARSVLAHVCCTPSPFLKSLRRAIARNGGDNERMIKVKKSTPHNPRTMCETSGKVLLAACWQKALKSALASPLSRSERARRER